VDRLGMQALGRLYEMVGSEAPKRDDLYTRTLIGDVISNSVYFGLTGTLGARHAPLVGTLLGLTAGLGAVVLPKPLGLDEDQTARTTSTGVLTAALYTAGGAAAGFVYRALSTVPDDERLDQTSEPHAKRTHGEGRQLEGEMLVFDHGIA
jgi:hypothetical protein